MHTVGLEATFYKMKTCAPDCLLIDFCDFESFPPGGQLSFAKQMISVFGERLALVGIATDDTPVGRWLERDISGKRLQFFNIGQRVAASRKPFIPDRLVGFLALSWFSKAILSLGIRNAFVQRPELLIVVSKWGMGSLCYRFPGVENPLAMPRYVWGKRIARLFDENHFRALNRTDVILACADEKAIDGLIKRSGGKLDRERVIQFATRVNTETFRPVDRTEARQSVGILQDHPVVVSCGRINRVKGWDFVLKSFKRFLEERPGAQLFFVGDGEDRDLLRREIDHIELEQHVNITGFQPPEVVAHYLNACDVVVVGSHREGWSIAMLEALACGKPVVSTDVSGARELIVDGENGFVLIGRNPEEFAKAMSTALDMKSTQKTSLGISSKYALTNLEKDLGSIWKPLA